MQTIAMRLTIAGGLAAVLAAGPAAAQEATEIKLGRAFGVAQLPFMVMEHQKLVEKRLEGAGGTVPKVSWATLGGGNVLNDALLSGELHYAVAGTTAFLVPWARTRGTPNPFMGVAAMSSTPMLLLTRNPAVKSIADLTDADRIALPAVKVSIQAVTLQMAARQAFGRGNEFRLDPFTVSLPHPDATAALIGGRSEVNGHFSAAPFANRAMKSPEVKLILNSYDVVGPNTTLNVVYSTTRFRERNPITAKAVLGALEDAIALINADRRKAAEIYLEMTRERSTVEDLMEVLADPQITFTTTPINMMKYADFMHEIGTLRVKPADWKELFFADVHGLPGS